MTPRQPIAARRTLRRALGCVGMLLAFAMPLTALADCCRCVGSDATKNICLNISTGGCATIQQQANNTNISSMTCDTAAVSPTQCAAKPQGICDTVADASTYNPNPSLPQGTKSPPIIPELNVPIPGLSFGAPTQDANGQLSIPFLSQYISAVYKYLLGISIVAAAVMIVYGGFKYILGSTAIAISSGKDTVFDALIGLFLVFASYTLLAVLNPSSVSPAAIPVTSISPDESWIQDHGTGDPFASSGAFQQAESMQIQGTPTPNGTYQKPQPGQPAAPPAPGQPPVPPPPSQLVDISNIPFDASLGGPANINKYCTTRAEASQATTYDDKVKLLVKAVLGWYKTCVTNHLCAYCQGCSTTIPGGQITAGALPTYIVTGAVQRGMTTPQDLWAGQQECIDTWNSGNKFLVNANPTCAGPAKDFYQKYFVDVLQQDKFYASDCGGFALTLYSCAGAAFTKPPTEPAYDANTKKTVNTAYLSTKSLSTYPSLPDAIASGYMNQDLLSLAAKKGGMRFGDLVYTCCGGTKDAYSAHWFMYTGGRPDVPFSFIEMGGVGAAVPVPGIPQGLSTVQVKPATWTLQDYINSKTTATPFYNKSGKLLWTIPASTDPTKGVVYVWRPYGDSPGAPGTGQ